MRSNSLYVVWNEHTLGYINPKFAPHMLGILRGSILRGALEQYGPVFLSTVDVDRRAIRPATPQDFDAYHCALPSVFQQATADQLNEVFAAINALMKVPA